MLKETITGVITRDQIQRWLEAALAVRGDAHLRRLIGFAQDVEQGKRVIFAAWEGAQLAGQATVQYASAYPPFRVQGIFEIVDVWTAESHRRQGIAEKLLHLAIDHVREKQAPAIGLGVGITANFGAAHRLYTKMGFMPDGTGLWVQGRPAKSGETVTLAEGVLLMWVKYL